MTEIQDRIVGLSQAKRSLLDLRLQKTELGLGASAPLMRRRVNRRVARLSFAQQRLWFLQQLERETPAYNIYGAMKLEGDLAFAALCRSLQEIVGRHEILRTRFRIENGEPVQVISDQWQIEIPLIDLSTFDPVDREQRTFQLAIEEAHTAFDLEEGPLLRVKLLKLKKHQHVLLVTMHHIISDGWSIAVLVRELGASYQAYIEGREAELPKLPIQYGDYAEWQREYLQGEVLEQQLSYWRGRLKGELPNLDFPVDGARGSLRTYRAGTEAFRIEPRLAEELNALSRKTGATLFMTLAAAYSILLARYCGQEEVLIGTPVANRTQVEVEDLIGCFVNTLVLRVNASGQPTFRELLSRVKQLAMEAYAHQDAPFEKLVEELQPKRDLSRTPLFQAMLVLQNTPAEELVLPGLRLTPVQFEGKVAKFDLTFAMEETAEGLLGTIEYKADLFSRERIRHLSSHWRRLLGSCVASPDTNIWELPLLEEPERRQIVEEWNRTEAEYPRQKTIVQLIEEQVQSTPERTALVYEGRRITYGELNKRANRLARWLQEQGVGPEVLVGLYLRRSLEMVVAVLGVLKAGGAYLPLDPEAPSSRLKFVLEESAIGVVLTQTDLAGGLAHSGVRMLQLDGQPSAVEHYSVENLEQVASPDGAAYVIYTSGSTGEPKGVVNTHIGLCNRLWWMQKQFRLGSDDAVLQKTPYTFDVSVWEFFWPLLAGARLVLARPEGHRDSSYLIKLIVDQGITTIHFVPSMLQSFLEEPEIVQCLSLRRVICSGEELSLALQERFFARLGWAELHNLYGPTEASIDVTHWHCRAEPGARSVPIGRPISNTRIHVLDRCRNPVPVGVPGELYIGGAGVARGYLRRPELTAEKFVPDPFSEEPSRLYRSGDLARFRPDGALEYLGRNDFQVKVRGFRIELEEIQSVLRRHEWVRECVVVAREDAPGGKQLVAYLVGDRQNAPTVTALRSWAKDHLLEYMVPGAFVMLSSMPLAHNGKVDRRALPAPDTARPKLQHGHAAPRTPTEQALSQIWAEVLKLDRVGVDDNFFELGGHSLLATQVISRIRDVLQVEVELKQIFTSPVLADFAAVVLQLQSMAQRSGVPSIKRRVAAKRDPLLARIDGRGEQEVDRSPNHVMVDKKQ